MENTCWIVTPASAGVQSRLDFAALLIAHGLQRRDAFF
jgi:hypothetical protein